MIGIVDYNAGNIKSVERALAALQIPYIISKNPCELEMVDKLIFPGVGDAAYAMKELHKTGFYNFLKEKVAKGTPLLGICLGAQIMFEHSEEGDTECLGLLQGKIVHFEKLFAKSPTPLLDANGAPYKIPHMGWNNLAYSYKQEHAYLFDGIDKDASFYFVHSYVMQPSNAEMIAGVADYGVKVPAIICHKNITACQFHPEKSAQNGLKLLANFCGTSCAQNK